MQHHSTDPVCNTYSPFHYTTLPGRHKIYKTDDFWALAIKDAGRKCIYRYLLNSNVAQVHQSQWLESFGLMLLFSTMPNAKGTGNDASETTARAVAKPHPSSIHSPVLPYPMARDTLSPFPVILYLIGSSLDITNKYCSSGCSWTLALHIPSVLCLSDSAY